MVLTRLKQWSLTHSLDQQTLSSTVPQVYHLSTPRPFHILSNLPTFLLSLHLRFRFKLRFKFYCSLPKTSFNSSDTSSLCTFNLSISLSNCLSNFTHLQEPLSSPKLPTSLLTPSIFPPFSRCGPSTCPSPFKIQLFSPLYLLTFCRKTQRTFSVSSL